MEIQWSDKMLARYRSPSLYLVDGDTIQAFTGKPIAGVCAVLSAKYTKAGKWSGTDYVISVRDGVIPVQVCRGWEEWGRTWRDIARNSFSDLSRSHKIKETHPEYPRWLDIVKRVAAHHIARYPETRLKAAAEEANANEAALASIRGGEQ